MTNLRMFRFDSREQVVAVMSEDRVLTALRGIKTDFIPFSSDIYQCFQS